MLTKRQNFLETIRGGKPDRYVNQYEYLNIVMGTPFLAKYPVVAYGQENVVGAWGVTWTWPEGFPGGFPVHTPDKIVIKDIENWRDYIQEPDLNYTEEDWAPYVAMAEKIDRKEEYVTAILAPGIFEMCHHLLEIQNCLMNFYEEPEAMHELVDYITDWEIRYAQELCKYIKPDALFHHDDWGSGASSFISPEMFDEYFVPAYKKIYGCYRDCGVQVIVHHSDSYAANLVPSMIEIGIDIWQGVMTSNKIEELIPKYGDKITFMGGIDSATIDRVDWSRDVIASEAKRATEQYGRKSFIPCNTMGGPESIYPGVYDTLTEEIEKINQKILAEGKF